MIGGVFVRKRALSVIFVILFAYMPLLSACGIAAQSPVGKWVMSFDEDAVFEFKSDKSGTITKNGDVQTFTYEINGDVLVISGESDEELFVFINVAVEDDILTMLNNRNGNNVIGNRAEP